MAMKKVMSSKMTKTTTAKPGKPKYEKLAPGERKAVRLAGVRKEAKKGNIAEIYTQTAGGGLVTSSILEKGGRNLKKGVDKRSIALQRREGVSRENLSRAGNIGKSYVEKEGQVTPKLKERQDAEMAAMNQAQFEKTRLGSRLANRARTSAAKQGKQVTRMTGITKRQTRG